LYTVRLLEALRELDDVEVVAFSDLAVAELADVVVRRSRLPLFLWRQVVLPGLVREAGCTSFHSTVTAMSLRLAVPVVATIHDLSWRVVPECYSWRDRLRQWFWFRRASRGADRLVAVSEATRAAVVTRDPGLADRTAVVRSGAIAARLPPPDPAERRAALGRFGIGGRFVLAVGRVERRKNPVSVIRAFASATERRDLSDVQLVFAGPAGNAQAEAAETARRLGIAGRVVFCSYVGDELAQLYDAAELLVYASLDEGFGHPPFEALSLGTPVVASDIPVIREVLDGGGELVPLDRPGALADAIRRVLSDSAFRADLLARGRKRLGAFSWRATAEGIAQLHRRLAEAG
ncbi:MAG: glycosyltransferase family 4 protein, partial [Planctomycetota bacterium]